ncbi:MAG TPA: hypothetical protein VMB02_02565, partial [Candidatus Aquilonibacter sp.]|nr:hypothetical protein [Candidatus Aquilonibacter sp.]
MTASNNAAQEGGAAAQTGINYQNRVAAWFAVRILAEDAASRPWDFPARPEFLRCETEQPVDDLLLGLSDSGFVFVQVKHRLTLAKDSASAFGETIDQFVRQYLVSGSATKTTNPWQRPLSPERDRLVCVTTSKSSAKIRQQLPRLLGRIRSLPTDLNPEDAPTTTQDKNLLGIFLQHVRRSWKGQLGHEPTAPQLREFLHLVRFEVLDVTTNGPADREAKDILLSSVLQQPSETESCWALLIDFCGEFARNHSGADRKELLHLLQRVRITVKAPQSYAADVECLKAYSSTTAKAVRDLSVIRLQQKEIKIARESTKALHEAAEKTSILVIGDPGAGKSGALHDFVQMLEREKRDHIFLAVDRLDAGSLTQVTAELGLNHDLHEVLSNWQGPDCAFVVIDALDAARAEAAAKAIKDLIAGVLREENRWHVVASIRKFDLRYDEELKELFHRGQPPAVASDFLDSEFGAFSHLKIPVLTNDELVQVFVQSPELAALVNVISSDLLELLRIPFNLRLLAQLVQEGVTGEELKPVRTQLQLLDKYWNYRVLRPSDQAGAQELLLNRACERMIESRTLRVDWKSVADPAGSAALDRLLSNHVLTEWQPSPSAVPDRSLLMYSHHVLFDYAVARLVLRGESSALVKRLAGDPELAIVIRPSFLYHFRHLWTSEPNHNSFWALTFQIASNASIPEIAKIIGPAVTAELVQTGSDFTQLLEWLQSGDSQRDVAETLIHHVVGARLATPSTRNWAPWCEFLERVSQVLRPRTAYSINSLLSAALEFFPSLSNPQKAALGTTARRLLEFAWAQSPRDGWLVIQGLRSVCTTFSADPASSGALLRRALEPEHVAAFGFEELSWLARGVDELVSYDPTLVEELYGAAFLHEETSEERTPMGPSRIFSLVSNRKQDFEMARFQLAEAYSKFLTRKPEHATRSMLLAAEGYVSRERNRNTQNEKERTFEFNNLPSGLRPDYSSIWDSGFSTQHVEALKIVSTFFDWLEQISSNGESIVDRVIAILAEKNRTALVWRRLLQLGIRRPTTIGEKIVPLVRAVPILTAFDTSTVAGEYLQAVFPLLAASQRLEIEHVVLSLPQTNTDDKPEFSEKVRNRLLGCLPLEHVCDPKTKELIEQLRTAQAIPKNEPSVQFTGPFFKDFGEDEYLREQGVPVEAEVNKKIRTLSNPVAAFATKHTNSNPSKNEVLEVVPLMRALREALESGNTEGAHRLQIDHAWGQLTEACERVSKLSELHCTDESQSFVRNTLLEASTHHVPEPHPEQDQQFDEMPSWGGPAARIAAAQGIANLCRIADCATPDVL